MGLPKRVTESYNSTAQMDYYRLPPLGAANKRRVMDAIVADTHHHRPP